MTTNFVGNHHKVLNYMLHGNASVYGWICHSGALGIQYVAVLSNEFIVCKYESTIFQINADPNISILAGYKVMPSLCDN